MNNTLCRARWKHRRRLPFILSLVLGAFVLSGHAAVGDQGGTGFWLPGQYGSFAAVTPAPGWSLPNLY
jgi:hypothetical protein